MVPSAPPFPLQRPACSGSQAPAPASPGPSHLLAGSGAVAQQCNTARRPGDSLAFYARGRRAPGPAAVPMAPMAAGDRGSWRRGQLEAGAGPALRRDAHRDALTRCQPTAMDVGAVAEKAAVVRKKKITGQSAGEPAWWYCLCCCSRPQ